MRCEYYISGKEMWQYVNIKFYHFELEDGKCLSSETTVFILYFLAGANCKYDKLTIYNLVLGIRYVPIATMYRQPVCGQRIPPDIRMGSKIFILLETNAWEHKPGFKFSYQLDGKFNLIIP